MEAARENPLAFAVPRTACKSICPNNPQERLTEEIQCHTDAVGIFPDRFSVVRPFGTVLVEQNDECAGECRYMGSEILVRCRLHPVERGPDESITTAPTA
ncbi:transposase [Kitasatospora sp. NPDC052896]|uniref:transposase n=1 Tax=Kitasatospora sp. NPDC052896 TaxID=3364061 RepID=UPI0037C9D8D0